MFEDFFGQFFAIEKVTARMVNNIDGAFIGDFQVNFYLYILLAIIAVIAIGYELYKYNKIVLKEAKFIVFVSLFVCWGALEFRSTLQYISYTSDDIHTLAGKTLDEKRALVSLVTGLHEFTQVVNKNVPAKSKIVIFCPDDDYIRIRIKYSLAPLEITFNPKESSYEAYYIAGFLTSFMPQNVIASSSYGWVARK